MAQKLNKNQRRSVFILVDMHASSLKFAERELHALVIADEEMRERVKSALRRAYEAGACAALDAEDGRPRDANVAP